MLRYTLFYVIRFYYILSCHNLFYYIIVCYIIIFIYYYILYIVLYIYIYSIYIYTIFRYILHVYIYIYTLYIYILYTIYYIYYIMVYYIIYIYIVLYRYSYKRTCRRGGPGAFSREVHQSRQETHLRRNEECAPRVPWRKSGAFETLVISIGSCIH